MPGPFTQREPRRYVGSYRPRIDGREKASGQAEYLDDIALGIKFPGLLHAKILRSPYPHARIKSVDTSRAEALPGVHCVLTYSDPEVAAMKPTTSGWTSANTASYDKMYYPNLCDRKVLADYATWAGDKFGVAVAAESEEIAAEALRRLDIEWEERPFALTISEALAEDAPMLHPEINPEGNTLPCEPIGGPECFTDVGDVDEAFAHTDIAFEVSSRFHRANHAVLDTRGCFCYWHNGQLIFYTNYYQADQTRMYLSQMLDLPLSKVRVINPYLGAQFGRCNAGEQPFFITMALLSRRTGRPVKYKMTLEEDFHDTRNAIDYVLHIGAKSDGTITAVHSSAVADAGGYSDHTMAAVKVVVKWDCVETLLAKIPNIRMESWAVYTNKIPGNCMRAIGNIQLNLAFGLAIDVLAEKLGLDPIDVALKNISHEWEDTPNASLTAVLAEGARLIGWQRRTAPGAGPLIDGTKRRGIGFSFHDCWHAGWQEQIRGEIQTTVKLNPDGSVILQAPMAEIGVGSNSCAVLACAEALAFLGVTPEDIHWIQKPDTESGLKDMVQTDSSVSYLHAELMPTVAAELSARLKAKAAPLLGAEEGELAIEEGWVFVVGAPERGMTVCEAMWDDYLVPITVTVGRNAPEEVTGVPFEATFAEVEVDTATGKVDIVKLAVVHDAGTVMFASGAEAQQVGGQSTGVGETLFEEIVYDRSTGIPLNFNWVDYTIPSMLDFPEVEPSLLEVWRGAGEYGACGIGEGAPCATPRAILNAVYNAIGARIDDIPVRPEKVLDALYRKEAGLPGRDEDLTVEAKREISAASCVSKACSVTNDALEQTDDLTDGPSHQSADQGEVPR
jgi:xanthine dehydrogenase molybdenum-binding subunit